MSGRGAAGASPVRTTISNSNPSSTATAISAPGPGQMTTLVTVSTMNPALTIQPSLLTGLQPQPSNLFGPNHAFLVTRVAMSQG